MPITQAQKAYLQSAIDYLLVFPAEKNELTRQITKFIEALNGDVPEDHDFYHLRKYLIHPTESLLGVEKYNADITIAEVQEATLGICLEAVENAAPKDDLLLSEFKTNLPELKKKLIPSKHHHMQFKSQQSTASGEYPWVGMQDAGQLFTTSLYLDETQTNVLTSITTKLPNGQELTHEFISSIENIHLYQNNYVNYLYHFMPLAKEYASKIAKETLLNFLFKQTKHIRHIEYLRALQNQSINVLVTNQFYFDLLFNNKTSLAELNRLSAEQCQTLVHEVVIASLQNKLCSLKQAFGITTNQLKILSSYYQLLKSGTIKIESILNSNDDQSSLLTIPLVINAINKQEITFEDVKKLSPNIKMLFSNSVYMEYFSRHGMDINELKNLSDNDINFLLKKEIAPLLINHVFSLNDVTQLTPEIKSIMSRKKINALLLNQQLTLASLSSLSCGTIQMIDLHPHLSNWIASGIISPSYIQPYNPVPLQYHYSLRLLALQKQTPLMIDGKADSAEKILEELNQVALREHIAKETLYERVISAYLDLIKNAIQSLLREHSNHPEYQMLNILIVNNKNTAQSPKDRLIDMMYKACDMIDALEKQMLNSAGNKTSPHFFQRVKRDQNPVYSFCTGLLGTINFLFPKNQATDANCDAVEKKQDKAAPIAASH